MALEISVGPPRLAINHGYGVLITDQDGQIQWPTDKGFYHSDTRVMSVWQVFADGEAWDLLNSGNVAHHAARIYLTNRRLHTETGLVPAGTQRFYCGITGEMLECPIFIGSVRAAANRTDARAVPWPTCA